MWIVRLALRRPYTFVVMAVLIAILGGAAIVTMPVDIFPYIDIPIVSVLWAYSGLAPEEMEKRVVTGFERSLTSNVNDIEHIESQAYNGYAVVRIYFHPNVKIDMAVAQVTASMETALRQMPPGMFPANVLKYDAASVPILQLGLSSKTLREQEIFDLGNNFIRTPLGTVQGASVSYPFGGKQRSVMVDLNLDELYAKQLSPIDVSNALSLQNLILPAGTAKMAETEYQIRVNSSPLQLQELNNLPIKTVNGATVYVKDVAQVHDGFSVQTNIVRTNGARGVLLTITRNGKASTLAIVDAVKAALPRILATLPPDLKVAPLFDQSIFVRAAIQGVVREALIAAGLTGLMILLFLGSWRSTLIVCISIPLSILTSLCILSLLGETINVMTLGGLALAVGILVDDATVEIENTHRNLAMRKPLLRAVLDGAGQIAVPTFVATLSICIVFVPVLLLTGTARYLFTPLAMAVVFAMLASYFLSRTLVPTMVNFLLQSEAEVYQRGVHGETAAGKGLFWRIHHVFNALFEALRYRYVGLLDWSLRHRGRVLTAFMCISIASLGLVWLVGEDFFPNVDSGQMRLHVRAPAGTRIEETELRFSAIERAIRAVIPADEIDTLIDNIGIPNSWTSIAQGDIPTISSADGEILISLNKEKHGSTRDYEGLLRKRLRETFSDMSFFFQAANITTQILSFGLPAPIDLQVVGRNAEANYRLAQKLAQRIARIPGAADVHVHQVVDQPEILLNVDRVKASQLGLTQRDVTNSMLISLSGNGSLAPNFWVNWDNGVNYNVGVQTPQYRIDSLDALLRTPISVATDAVNTWTPDSQAGTAGAGNASVGASPNGSSQAYGNPGAMMGSTQLLSNLATVRRSYAPVIVNHYNVWPVFDVYANVYRRDLGGVGGEVEKIVREEEPHLPRGTSFALRGQIETMQSSFFRLGLGMLFAVVLVYLLMAVNFQSWLDPFIILMALPGALAGILWMLFVTGTTLSVPSLMGAIMCIGVATANSILMVTFANDERATVPSATAAMLSAGHARIRPVLMTATAMIIGMLPMSLGLGEGGEQNAPLGRAVIGGLMFATVATLFVVPIIYSYLRTALPIDHERRFDEQEQAELPSEWNNERSISQPLMQHIEPDLPGSIVEATTEEERLRSENQDLKRQLQKLEASSSSASHAGPARRLWNPSGVTIWSIVLLATAVLVLAFFAGYIPLQRRKALNVSEAQQQETALPRMEVVEVGRSTRNSEMELPGNIQAITEAPILARADGYLLRRMVDIGDRVRSGQPLADIEAPELDEQVDQAKANLQQARAALDEAQANYQQGKSNMEFARVTAERWGRLAARGAVSRQENDQYQSQSQALNANLQSLEKAIAAQRSTVSAAESSLARLQKLQGYLIVKAPFDGVITMRNVDTGALVNAGNTLLFRIAQTDTLRTYVNVPQADTGSIRTGQTARLSVSNLPGRQFVGTVARTANSLDPNSRTLLVEVHVPNADGALLPGMYAQVDLNSTRANPPLLIPSEALIVRADGASVALVRPDHTVHFQKIRIGRDYGDRLEVSGGLREGDVIIPSPGDVAREGLKIDPVSLAQKASQQSAPAGAGK